MGSMEKGKNEEKDKAKYGAKAGGNVPHVDGLSMNVHRAQVDQLRAVCPGVFTDGKVDFDKLAHALRI